MTCINCGTEVTGSFCGSCGQRSNVKRITFKEGWFDFWSRIYGFDGMFPRTLRDLTLRPGTVAQKFIDGNRVLYYGPVGYYFLMITLFLLLLSFLNLDFVDFMRGMQEAMALESKSALQTKFQRFYADNLKMFGFLIIPFQVFAVQKIFFRKSGKTFLELTILPFYTLGHLYWLIILSAIYYKISGSLMHILLQPIVSIVYYGYAFATFMTYQSPIKAFLKGVFSYITGLILFTIALMLGFIAYVIYLAVVDPNTLQMLK